MKIVHVISLALLASACETGGDYASPPRETVHVQLRLRGIASSQYTNVLLDVDRVSVAADGQALAVTPPQSRMDLSDTTIGWVAGEFDVPAGARNVQVALRFDEFGGYEGAGGAGAIDARTVPVKLEAEVAELAIHNKMVVQLDVGRSLVAAGAERRLLLPYLSVAY